MAWSNNLFYIAFTCQIFLMSYYLPTKVLARMKHVLKTYPPETYPKLYPRPISHYKIAHAVYKYVTGFVLLLGIFLLYAIMFRVDHSRFADHGFVSVIWPGAYGLIQFLPLMAVEFSEFSHFKQMREANPTPKRIAELRRRNLSDLVSPVLIGMAVSFLAGAILFDLYIHDFIISFAHDTTQRALVVIGTNFLLASVGIWNVYGKKLDPHQSPQDRAQRMAVSVKSLLYVSMALSVYVAVSAADDIYNMDAIDAVIMSVYFQTIALLSLGFSLKNLKLEDIDFDVYRRDVATT